MNKTLKKVGKAIATARKAKGMTQDQLADAVGMDRSYLSEIENGHKNLSVIMLMDIAEALGVRAGGLLI